MYLLVYKYANKVSYIIYVCRNKLDTFASVFFFFFWFAFYKVALAQFSVTVVSTSARNLYKILIKYKLKYSRAKNIIY